jgi:hypothetical protein
LPYRNELHVDKATFGPRTRKDVLARARQSFQHCANRLIDWNEAIFAVLGNTNVDQASRQVHAEPGEIENLALSHSRVDRHRRNEVENRHGVCGMTVAAMGCRVKM